MSNFIDFLKPGVINAFEMHKVFNFLRKKKIALAAVNCIDSNSINSVLETARKLNTLIIIQFSFSGSIFFIGKKFSSKVNQIESAVKGAVLGAKYVHEISKFYKLPVILHTDHCIKENLLWIDYLLKYNEEYNNIYGYSLFSSHMIDLSNCDIKKNLSICSNYLIKFLKLNINLEIELGCTGGEEDGLDNSNISNEKLYTNPNDVLYAYGKLIKISKYFTIAASFGNIHGVYKYNMIRLSPKILLKSQLLIKKFYSFKNLNNLNFVFHGGSGTSENIIKESIEYGVVKINLDTDVQWFCWKGILEYYLKNKNYLESQLGNPKGLYNPNKKFYDPRVWIRLSQESVILYLKNILKKFNCLNLLKYFNKY